MKLIESLEPIELHACIGVSGLIEIDWRYLKLLESIEPIEPIEAIGIVDVVEAN